MPDNPDVFEEGLLPESPAPGQDQDELQALIRGIVAHNDPEAIARFFDMVQIDIRMAVQPYAAINQAGGLMVDDLVNDAAVWFLEHFRAYDPDKATVRTWVRQYSRHAVRHAHPEWNAGHVRHERNGGYINDVQQVADGDSGAGTSIAAFLENLFIEQHDNRQLLAAIESFPAADRNDRLCVKYMFASLAVMHMLGIQ